MIREILTAGFMIVGSFFILIAALGTVRFPDLYTRMHAASKSISLGIGCMLIGPILYFSTVNIILKAVAAVLFIFLTMPVASHMISRVAYKRKVGIYEKTLVDELKER
jgi:multicomponent Na+:H+ antiporter subunit G